MLQNYYQTKTSYSILKILDSQRERMFKVNTPKPYYVNLEAITQTNVLTFLSFSGENSKPTRKRVKNTPNSPNVSTCTID